MAKMIGSLKNQAKLGKEVKRWEEDLIMNLNNMSSSEEDYYMLNINFLREIFMD